ncbi:MAG: MraY family glycosyltransferase [bacterium]
MTLTVLMLAILAGYVATRLSRKVALAIGFVNHPNPIIPDHRVAVAYLGGLGIQVGALAALLIARQAHGTEHWLHPGYLAMPQSLLVGGALFALLGLYDDKRPLRASVKLVLQALVVVMAQVIGELTPGDCSLIYHGTPWFWLNAGWSMLWILAIVNAMNFVDVCDGLAGTIAMVTFAFFAWFIGPFSGIALALSGACLGFLLINRPPARVYMGDAGSNFLGFMMAAFTIIAARDVSLWPSMPMWVLWVGVPFFELLFISVVRAQKGLPWWHGSPDHFALRLQKAGFTKMQVDAWSAGFVALFWLAALGLYHAPNVGLQITVVLMSLGVCIAVWRYLLNCVPGVAEPPAPTTGML